MSQKGNPWIVGGLLGVGAIAALSAWERKRREFELAGKVVLITGGSRGLGLVLAREFAHHGARIAICARSGDELARAKAELETRGAEVFTAVCDVRNRTEAETLIENVCNRFGRIDVLVNNAGVIQVGPLEVQTQKDFEDSLAIHFWAPFYLMQATIPHMKKQGAGRILNISSIGGKIAVPHLAPYCAGKFALKGLSDAMRGELRKENIFVTTVCPGLMRTGSHVNAYFKGQNEKEFALFSISNALPVSSVSAESAARQIVRAARRGDAELVISPQAKLAAQMNALFPELTTEILAFVNQILPAAGGIGTAKVSGKESASPFSPSILTALADNQIVKNNELTANQKGEFYA